MHVVEWLLAHRTEGCTSAAIQKAKTDEIARVVAKSLSESQSNAMIEQAFAEHNVAFVRRLLSLLSEH
ncbi:hypothetical protein BC831DRAFT_464416 [Entophlyctis helioformis]|nr:hypothetical protein BC831DRAFT_464398 [Entophlyctis helioformis]KAI8924631.1 hypothetical protein BC831DRAFT_464416 [Entophlyctis helioformis]